MTISFDLTKAAEVCGLSKRSLQYAIDDGALVAHYGGEKNSKPVVRPADLDAYIQSLPTRGPARTRTATK